MEKTYYALKVHTKYGDQWYNFRVIDVFEFSPECLTASKKRAQSVNPDYVRNQPCSLVTFKLQQVSEEPMTGAHAPSL